SRPGRLRRGTGGWAEARATRCEPAPRAALGRGSPESAAETRERAECDERAGSSALVFAPSLAAIAPSAIRLCCSIAGGAALLAAPFGAAGALLAAGAVAMGSTPRSATVVSLLPNTTQAASAPAPRNKPTHDSFCSGDED